MMQHDSTVGPGQSGWADDPAIPQALREAWLRDGLVVFPGLVSADTVDLHVAAVAALRAEVPNGRDDYGLGDRIGQLHQKLPELVDTIASERLLGFLNWALDDEPLLFASLNFDRGTQQESHVDLIYFCIEPLYAMAGVWIALEDIDLNAGPLFYHLGSHHWPFDYPGESAAGASELAGDDLGRSANAWLDRLRGRVDANRSEKIPMVIRKGDAVVWHAKLAHGGMPRLRPELSRKSVVYHFIGASSRLYSFSEFFTYPRDVLLTRAGVQVPQAIRRGLRYQVHPYFVTYDGGNEIVHPLE
jgi:hypothetical protein